MNSELNTQNVVEYIKTLDSNIWSLNNELENEKEKSKHYLSEFFKMKSELENERLNQRPLIDKDEFFANRYWESQKNNDEIINSLRAQIESLKSANIGKGE